MSRNSFSYRLENLKKAFVDQITPCIMDGMMSIYEECVAINNSKTNVNATFKEILDQIPGWKNDILDGENNRILMCIKSADKLSVSSSFFRSQILLPETLAEILGSLLDAI